MEHIGFKEDAWANLCPESELEWLECLQEKSLNQDPNPTENEIIPDESTRKPALLIEFQKHKITQIMRSLNDLQAKIFYKIHQWCLDKVCTPMPISCFYFWWSRHRKITFN